MQELANSLIDNTAQCWACPIFDTLFAIISNTAAAAYERLSFISVIIFCVLFSFYVFSAVWQNWKKPNEDPFFKTSIRPVLIKALLAISLLAMGTAVPKLISTITFEPAAVMTLSYSKVLLPEDYVVPDYPSPIKLDDSGFFNPDLRDTILQILETSVANFQVYIKFGIAIMHEAFTIKALLGLGSLIRHIIIFFIGLFLTYNFAKLFLKYSVWFMDVIVAMAMFAFFFPLSVVFFIFKGAKHAPKWMESLGGNLGTGQVKKLINAIVSLASAILTYSIIMLIIHGYFVNNGVDPDSIQNSAQSIFDFDLENSTAMQITFAGAIVLVYVINYIETQIPQITEKILSTFGIKQENALSKEMGENVLKLTSIIANKAKELAGIIRDPDKAMEEAEKKKEEKKDEGKKDDKKGDKK